MSNLPMFNIASRKQGLEPQNSDLIVRMNSAAKKGWDISVQHEIKGWGPHGGC